MGKVGKMGKMAAKTPPRMLALRPPPWRKPLQEGSALGLPARLQRHTALVRPVDSGKSNIAFTFKVCGCIDQDRRRWIKVISGTKSCRVPLDHFIAVPQEALKRINSAGILIINERAKTYLKNQVQGISEWKRAYIADHRGWHDQNRCFALTPDYVLGRQADRERIQIAFDDASVKWTKRGTQGQWLQTAQLMVGQSRPIFLACHACVPPLLSVVHGFDNIGVELVGPPGIGKSTVAKWVGSIWGGDPTRPTGFLETWATTLAGLEETIPLHSDCLLGLDETNLAGSLNNREVRQLLESAVFRLGHGVAKVRYGVPIRHRSDRLCWMSTSNVPLAEILARSAPEVAAAAAQRLITVPAQASEFGIFDWLPLGFSSSSELLEHPKSASDQVFGITIRAYLMHLVPMRRDDEASLRERLETGIQRFLQQCGVDPNDGTSLRVARSFGLIYAAGALAQYWSVLPRNW